MSVFTADCPHCGTSSVAFAIVYERRLSRERGYQWDTFATCGRCGRGVVANFETPNNEPPKDWLTRPSDSNFWLRSIFPSRPDSRAPDHTTSNVARFFEQGVDNLPGNWDAAGAMFRKALEATLKDKFPAIGGSLYNRIEGAAREGGLTPDLAAWSHRIRLDGGNAVHEEEPYSKGEAERLHDFTNLVLLYLYTLPGMLAKARGEDADATDED